MDFIGEYRIDEELGQGSMGVVYKGYDPKIRRWVAIKLLRMPEGTGPADIAAAVLRFGREAEAAGRLSHPNIATIYRMGEHLGHNYIAMEFVAGRSLDKLLLNGETDLAMAMRTLSGVAAGLDYAHRKNVYHRDIKPANIIIGDDGTVKIVDFGVAKIVSDTVTQTGMAIGSLAYMAPEQMRDSRNIDARADQYSLAVTTYEMFCGRRPFMAGSVAELMLRVLTEEAPLAHHINSDVPSACSDVIARALNKKPSDRYESCQCFVAELMLACKPTPQAGETRINPKDGLAYVWIPPGRFLMTGGLWAFHPEEAQHDTIITRGYWIGQRPVSGEAYRRVMGTEPALWNESGDVAIVDWQSATEYSSRVAMRLATEAEWEYAARAGKSDSRDGNVYKPYGKVPNAWNLSYENSRDLRGSSPKYWCEWVANWDRPSERQHISSPPYAPAIIEVNDIRITWPCPSVAGFRSASEVLPSEP